MWQQIVALAAFLAIAVGALSPASAEDVPLSRERIGLSFAPIVRETAPAVVNIYTEKASQPLAQTPISRLNCRRLGVTIGQ